jgi:uncharacterized protein YjiS (DUF1127 family)
MAMADFAPLHDWSTALAPLAGWPEAATRTRRAGALERLWTGFRRWQAQRTTVRLLNSLDDATLKDLAISPRDVEWLVYGDRNGRMRGYDRDWWRR